MADDPKNPDLTPKNSVTGNTPVAGKPPAPPQPGQRAPQNVPANRDAAAGAVLPPGAGTGAPANQSMSQFTQSDEGKAGLGATQPAGMKRAEELPPESGNPTGVVQPGSPEDAARGFEMDRSPTAAPSSPKE